MISCIFNEQKFIVVYIEWMYVKQQQNKQKKAEKNCPVVNCPFLWLLFFFFFQSILHLSFPPPLSSCFFSFTCPNVVNTMKFSTMLIWWTTCVCEEEKSSTWLDHWTGSRPSAFWDMSSYLDWSTVCPSTVHSALRCSVCTSHCMN